jgi:hypothetical protein
MASMVYLLGYYTNCCIDACFRQEYRYGVTLR